MPNQLFIENVRALISSGQTAAALEQLKLLLQDSRHANEVILQNARFNALRQQIRLGLVGGQEPGMTHQQIREGVLDLLVELEKQSGEPTMMPPDSKEEAMEYARIRKKIRTNRGAGTEEILLNKNVKDLDEQELERFFEQERVLAAAETSADEFRNLSSREKLLRLSLADNGHIFKGTLLCLGQRNQIRAVSQTATESKFIIFKGKERVNILALESLEGNLLRQFDRMMFLLRFHNPLGRNRERSEEVYETPMEAIREFMTNAFVHRDYGPEVRSYIQVEIFDDRIEIKSPGQLPSEVDVNNVIGTVHVNPTLAAIFYLSKHMERAGTGINSAQSALQIAGIPKAVIENLSNPDMVRVTI